jgi:hypothetical protein
LKTTWIALICGLSVAAWGQIGNYLGPGVLSRGAGDIGTRSGQDVDLRYYFDVTGVYETGLQPFALDSKGNLIQINGLYGIQADIGAYGRHSWKRALLGLDYKGNFYHYDNNSFYDSSSHNLTLGYTFQESRRIIYEMQAVAGTSSLGYGGPGFYNPVPITGSTDVVNTPTSLLFDSRVYYLEPSMQMTYIQSARTSYSFGGSGFFIRRAARGLADLNGYSLEGTIRHRLSQRKTISFTYTHVHYDFPPAFGQADLNEGTASYSTSIGKRLTFNIAGGVTQAEVQGVQQIALDPVVAALLGVNFGQQTFYRANYYPNGQINLTARLRTSSLAFSAAQQTVPGNGVYLTSEQQSGALTYSYTGVRKLNAGINLGYSRLSSIGQGIRPYSGFNGGVGFTYNLTHALHFIARADSRYQQINVIGYNRTGYRASVGLGFSPGNVPLSLW